MFDYFIILLITVGYLGLSYITIRQVRKWTKSTSNYCREIIISLSYTLFFGIGLVASGGGPGFGFPCPILLAGALGIIFEIPFEQFLKGVIYSFIFWWVLILLISLIRNKLRTKSTK
ncbi:hypothetical protein C9994_01990 [Marivirga lumbricoides]|uniref:Uncharacterized protein n=1 Tax=Marivirga lumbricoides TaxID=1046115 RepID=A0A2T4DV01_9BACT|nr:hypothetical protein C9994_01990 [Marivirga lumbricoides]